MLPEQNSATSLFKFISLKVESFQPLTGFEGFALYAHTVPVNTSNTEFTCRLGLQKQNADVLETQNESSDGVPCWIDRK